MRIGELVGKRVAEMLKLRNMTQIELSRKSGLARSLISELIAGKRDTVNLDTVIKLGEALGINPDFFYQKNVVGPTYILDHLSEEDKKIIIDDKKAPYIVLTRKAIENGIELEDLETLINILMKSRKKSKKSEK